MVTPEYHRFLLSVTQNKPLTDCREASTVVGCDFQLAEILALNSIFFEN